MSANKMSIRKEFSKGLVKENPVLRLMLGVCPTLAVTTTARNGLGMGLAATFVLVSSNIVISLLRPVIPEKVRIPAFITIIASLVTIVQMLMQAFLPDLNQALGIFIPLITVNCIILARAEMFASKYPLIPSIADGLGMGIGYTVTLFLMGSIREIIGNGSFLDLQIPFMGTTIDPMLIMILPPGGFFAYGLLIALSQKLADYLQKRNPQADSNEPSGGAISEETACLLCGGCSLHKSLEETAAETRTAKAREVNKQVKKGQDGDLS